MLRSVLVAALSAVVAFGVLSARSDVKDEVTADSHWPQSVTTVTLADSHWPMVPVAGPAPEDPTSGAADGSGA
ncbi:hypothetical protein ABZ330_21285 [Streptomyces sp. NPDC006172]|uniref:hypothetical protein n=1 Tax=Streptomyces sp. NPDC006172 TaxID=3154470 RepID=UPI0033CC3C88